MFSFSDVTWLADKGTWAVKLPIVPKHSLLKWGGIYTGKWPLNGVDIISASQLSYCAFFLRVNCMNGLFMTNKMNCSCLR